MNFIKREDQVTVSFSNGEVVKTSCTEDQYQKILRNFNEEFVRETLNLRKSPQQHLNSIENSLILYSEGTRVFMRNAPKVPLPLDLIFKILEAEANRDDLDIYRNFWMLACRNPNPDVIVNLFWFLKKYGMVLDPSGLILAYRLVVITDEIGVFTDKHSGSTRIVMGTPVTMDRNKCDHSQEQTCSKGLHAASKEWLKDNYSFGEIAIKVLLDPGDIVAIPPKDSYGKLRTCRYFPVCVIEDLSVDDTIPTWATDAFIQYLNYSGPVVRGLDYASISDLEEKIPSLVRDLKRAAEALKMKFGIKEEEE